MPNVSSKECLPGSRATKQNTTNISSTAGQHVRPSKEDTFIDSFDRRWYRRVAGNLVKIHLAHGKGKLDQEQAMKRQLVLVKVLLEYKRSLVDRKRWAEWHGFLASVDLPDDAHEKLS